MIKNEFNACLECELCNEVCPVFKITENPLFSPLYRLKTAAKIVDGEDVSGAMMESMYNCPKCMLCEFVCPEEIKITAVVHKTREELAKKKLGPLKKHKQVIRGIIKNDNSVGGNPEKRLDWLPEEFLKKESDTILYLGCIPSYLVKDVASSTYLVLKKLGFDFMIIKDEGCCGTYLYESGRTDLADEYFSRNVDKFNSLGIKRIVVPCNGCLKCFKYFYPDLLGEMTFTVVHALEVIYELVRENPDMLKKVKQTITYQDPCRLARGEKMTEEPRELLKLCGAELAEVDKNRDEAACCGAGGGIRSVYGDLSFSIAENLLNTVNTETIVTACPFCTFNLRYAAKRICIERNMIYFSRIVLDSL